MTLSQSLVQGVRAVTLARLKELIFPRPSTPRKNPDHPKALTNSLHVPSNITLKPIHCFPEDFSRNERSAENPRLNRHFDMPGLARIGHLGMADDSFGFRRFFLSSDRSLVAFSGFLDICRRVHTGRRTDCFERMFIGNHGGLVRDVSTKPKVPYKPCLSICLNKSQATLLHQLLQWDRKCKGIVICMPVRHIHTTPTTP